MTGFGEGSGLLELAGGGQVSFKVICKSVNNRFLDVSLRLPPKLSHLDYALQKIIRPLLSRGKVDISVTREVFGQNSQLLLNVDVLNRAIEDVSKISLPGIAADDLVKITFSSLLARKEVLDLTGSETDIEAEAGIVEKVILEAVGNLIQSRKVEGERLTTEVLSIIQEMNGIAAKIEKAAILAPKIIKEKFNERLSQLYVNYAPDDQRLLQEIAILSDKVDVREEIVRLNSHLLHFKEVINEGGRKLEFIVQEMGREINTIGSKTSQIEVSAMVIDMKSYLEKLREQLQNIE